MPLMRLPPMAVPAMMMMMVMAVIVAAIPIDRRSVIVRRVVDRRRDDIDGWRSVRFGMIVANWRTRTHINRSRDPERDADIDMRTRGCGGAEAGESAPNQDVSDSFAHGLSPRSRRLVPASDV